MSLRFKQFYYIAFIAVIFSLSAGAIAQTRSYRVSDRQIQTLLNRIETRTDAFRQNIERAYNNDDRNNSNLEDGINSSVTNFENATDALKSSFAERRSTTEDVREVLSRAAHINGFMRDNPVTRATQNQWNLIRNDLNTLANYYSVSWNWNNPTYPDNQNYPNNQMTGFDSRLTGTYRLNVRQSDNVSATIDRAISKINYNQNQRERTKNNLERRLTSPDMLMIEKQGQQVTLGSSTS